MDIIKYIENLLEKENTVKNVGNFTPYGTDPKKDKMVKSNNWKERLKMAKQGYGLDILVNDKNWVVRHAVAKQGYGLDILINDEDFIVRAAVAEQGYGLNILVNDERSCVLEAVFYYLKKNNLTLGEWYNQNDKEFDLRKLAFSPYPKVRIAAIESGYIYKKGEVYIAPDCKFTPYGKNSEKDKMIKSNNWKDHLKIAKENYGLNVLINDEDYDVRRAVAEQGYGLDILINDKIWKVRRAAKNYLTSHNLTLEQWKSNQDPSELSVSISKAEEFNSLDINTLKSEIQNLKDQINILIKESKSLKETLENYTSLEKGNGKKEL